ncbi:hypothetical protein JHK87_048932 [Glycine soja]|nr:hypothetical protein JHK87_048932 [Glycine soja]
MAFGNRILYFITFTCLLHSTKPSNFNGDTLFQGHDQLTTTNSLICSSGLFTLSFFQLDESEYFYLGIRLSVVNSSYNWVANRDEPIRDPSVALTIDQYGNLKIISNGGNSTIMLYSSSKPESNSNSTIITSAILQDNGNFVLQEINQDGSVKNILWQSFDYPTNMLLPGMKLGFDRKTGQNWSITSWRSGKSPLSGSFSLGLDHKTKEMVMWWRGKIVWSSGQWSNGNFANLKSSLYEKDFVFEYYSDEDETYVKYVPVYGYIIMGSLGIIYGSSGASYSCSDNKYFLSGCSMPSAHKCTGVDSLYLGSSESRYGVMAGKGFIFDAKEKLSHFDCWMKCLNNCSCEAYSYVNADATGCEIWSKGTANFSDTNNLITGSRQIYFIRSGKAEKRKKQKELLTDIGRSTAISIAYGERKEQRKDGKTSDETYIFDFQTILEATANFSSTNKIGEGGFGPVYKAWKLWNEGEALNLTDTLLDGSCPPNQVLRYIHIGLLCTQDQAKERPTMVQVVSFLSNEIAELPLPKQPGFCSSESMEEIEQPKSCSNEITMSLTSDLQCASQITTTSQNVPTNNNGFQPKYTMLHRFHLYPAHNKTFKLERRHVTPGSSAHNNPPFDFIFKLVVVNEHFHLKETKQPQA